MSGPEPEPPECPTHCSSCATPCAPLPPSATGPVPLARNLATALAVEAAELLEPFQWLTEEQGRNLDAGTRAAVEEELADVLLYWCVCGQAGLDLQRGGACEDREERRKYPVDKARGSSRKYDAL